MIYDNTSSRPNKYTEERIQGFTIHENSEGEHLYSLYTDDGRGNGNYICGASELYWIRRIAHGLDAQDPRQFNYHGELK